MPARLRSLELQGYKTFANKTVFGFGETVTAIVGPNGSGKSNIADSLRWVLGEQSYSILRGKKTEDMIFSGSELRPRAGMASATVTFDNADNWLPIDFSEVAITRRAYRDGTNEYLINGQRVRLKDVTELLSQSGLAERTYTIIGQGLVDAALALKAEDRRKLFEEAAGIGLYRARREESLRRLETTRRNLERVDDILAELEPRLRSLERQAKRAQEYEQVKADLQLLLREWYGYHWHLAQRELMEARNIEKVQLSALEKAQSHQQTQNQQLSEVRRKIQVQRSDLNDRNRLLSELRARREVLSRELAVSAERARSIESQVQSAQDEILRIEDEIILQGDLIASIEQDAARLETDRTEAQAQVDQAKSALSIRQKERGLVEGQVQDARQKLTGLTGKLAQLEASQSEKTIQLERDLLALETSAQSLIRYEIDLAVANDQSQVAQERLSVAETQESMLEESLQTARQRFAEIETNYREVTTESSQILTEIDRLQARIDVLDQAEAALTGYAEGTRLLIKSIRQDQISGKPGALSQYLHVSAEHERAISVALGEFLESVLINTDLEDIFQLLDNQGGRAALIPLSTIIPELSTAPPDFDFHKEEYEGWIGVANELVQTTSEMRRVVDALLSSVWIVRDRGSARNILHSLAWQRQSDPFLASLRIVTLKGELFFPSGAAVGGSTNNQDATQTLLSRQRQRQEFEGQITVLSERLSELDLLKQTLDSTLSESLTEIELLSGERRDVQRVREQAYLAHQHARLDIEQASRQLGWQQEQRDRLESQRREAEEELGRLKAEITDLRNQIAISQDRIKELNSALAGMLLDEYQTQVSHWNTRVAVVDRALQDEKRRLDERQQTRNKLILNKQIVSQRITEQDQALITLRNEKTASRQEAEQIDSEIEELEEQIRPLESSFSSLERDQIGLEELEVSARQSVSLADHRHGQAKLVLIRRQEALQSLQRRIEEDFGLVAFEYAEQVTGQSPLPLSGMVEQLPRVVKLSPEIDENIKRQRAQLRRIGPINPEAQAEHKSVKERFIFMSDQVADLRKAEADILEVIQELDILMQRDFKRTFDAVAVEFKAIFQRLFGGGFARLVLTDPENLTESGIDIEARLPGRRTQGLSLLSGGERSLAATSLVFALMKVAPTPFCVLDEVDAMLDEANVGRFRDLLRELSAKTQFVIVTHNRNTVQVAEVIYGVTMGRDSASQVISLKMDQVEQVFE